MSPPNSCDLCGLPLRYGTVTVLAAGKTLHFCCLGCKHVYSMLTEASHSGDPSSFRETELFKKCLELGIIPKSESDLKKKAKKRPASHKTLSEHDDTQIIIEKKEKTYGDPLGLTLTIGDMWCPACAWVIDEALKKSAGVIDSVCNFSTDRVRCEYDPIVTSPAEIIETITGLGYPASFPGESAHLKKSRQEFIRFGISSFLTMNVMMLSFALYSGFFSELSKDAIYKISWPIIIMASCVLFYGGAKIFQKAWSGVTNAAYSMETLISVGALSAYLYSAYNFLVGSIHLYFDTAAMLITLVLLGKLLERRAKDRIQENLERFFLLMPSKVRLCTALYPDGRHVDIEQLKKDDIFRVEETEIVPADGVIIEGKGSVDESSLTGEALPITKKAGDTLKSGSKITGGIFKVKAESVGEDSLLGQMIQIMETAIDQKMTIEGSTDTILRWFVPIIMILAFSTGFFSILLGLSQEASMMRSVTVLVIACPCALGIAIPLARVAGVSMAGKKGVLVRNFSAFTQAEKVNAFVFDKTGTITQGDWALRRIFPFGTYTEDEILSMAASLEKDSDNYIAVEVKRLSERRHLDLQEIADVVIAENGISGWIKKKEAKIGSSDFLKNEIRTSAPAILQEDPPLDTMSSKVFMSLDGRLCALLFFGDKIRQGAFPTIERLRLLGHHIALVSGDGEETTKAVGKKLGIDDAHGGKMPQDKAFFVRDMQKKGLVVSMIGDGVNDAPALANSDLSFAIFSGNNPGKEAADVTLMRSGPEQMLEFFRLAKQVQRKISQNLVFSFFYNLISIPVAMAGLLTPLIAVCAMLMSSLTVIGNTLLLIRKQ